jgi:hypothetical protein
MIHEMHARATVDAHAYQEGPAADRDQVAVSQAVSFGIATPGGHTMQARAQQHIGPARKGIGDGAHAGLFQRALRQDTHLPGDAASAILWGQRYCRADGIGGHDDGALGADHIHQSRDHRLRPAVHRAEAPQRAMHLYSIAGAEAQGAETGLDSRLIKWVRVVHGASI